MTQNDIVQKLWNLCDVLKDDGINYSDYVSELVMLLFVKMVDELDHQDSTLANIYPDEYRWAELRKRVNQANDLLVFYKEMLLELSQSQHELIASIYNNAQTRLREPRHLAQLIKEFDKLDWFSIKADGLGDLYEGLLEKNATETKSGAGQYFTPRPLINSIVRCMQPKAGEVIQDPACGTAGFLIAADAFIKSETDDLFDLNLDQKKFQETRAFVGVELVPNTRRLAQMNCLLHDIGGEQGAIKLGNSLGSTGFDLPVSDVILANPPFGTSKGGEASITRQDLPFDTSNKQLAFLQHIYLNLKPGGRAAVVLPDNVLFEAGQGTAIRQDLINKCNVHTILRLPTGIFYAAGVKTNVLFFTKGTEADPMQKQGCTQDVWVYDLRTNMPSFGKRTPFTESHLKGFEAVYGANAKGLSPRTEGEWSLTEESQEQTLENSRWRKFSREWIKEQKGDSLDISWLKDNDAVDAANLPEPHVLASEAMSELTQALVELDALMKALGQTDEANTQKQLLADALCLGNEEQA
ncbi:MULTISPECIES: type I restriction-modification system subunit M [unclassified Acinetobacter]|uniref:type I restriction-modification system subunit M n=1 Tax=unclassified Acinetobacter TaxID=196816 RepID=UPI0015D33083|nr:MULTISPECIES: type I restriction-modification system subunit M [unclassified Acinetobacter]UUS60118.1 type I restriction-modification system subunit M [Acinetobacter sp. YH16056_T]